MKTILYNPIFINPQAYYVFPRLTRYLQPDNESTVEPANYIGTIEVKVIAYGDTTLKRTYSNTDYIDLSEFKDTWIRISLFTKVGSCVLGEWKIGDMQTDLPYIEPEVLASLKAVVVVGNKSNSDSDRAIVRNLVDKDNPFVISNAAFKLNSGFGEYSFDFERWGLTKPPTTCIRKNDSFNITYVGNPVNEWLSIVESSNTSDSSIDLSFKVEITGLEDDMEAAFVTADTQRVLLTNGINVVNITIKSKKWYGFNFIRNDGTALGNCNIVVRQIPGFQGAFVTDGIDDLITSTKTVQEMGVTDEVTVVSMIHHIDIPSDASFNNIRNSTAVSGRNGVYASGTTGIYGWSKEEVSGASTTLINNILGDKNNYTNGGGGSAQVGNMKFSVQGFISDSGVISETSSVAWYWTIIANKVLTTDQINQVIAYFNLDRTLKPDILCDVKKQGITNENHAEFGDKLIDFSGNGRDIQLNNIAWNGNSGIGKYNFSNINIIASNRFEGAVTTNKCHFTKKLTNTTNNFCDLLVISPNEPIKFKVSGLSDGRKLFVANKSGSGSNYNFDNGEYEVSLSFSEGVGQNNPFGVTGDIGDIDVTVEFIPSHAGALCLDGVNGFGKVTGMPIYKDYTFIIDYERISYASSERWVAGVVSKSHVANQGAFILMTANTTVEPGKQAYSFGGVTSFNRDDFTRALLYQSKYKCGDVDLTVGEGVDSDTLWLGTFRDNDQRFFNGAIYSLMSFPYSMSEFLIERQLKKHKLGTLYPDMVEFRPIVKSNSEYQVVNCYIDTLPAVVGNYYPINSKLRIAVTTKGAADEVTSLTVNGVSLGTPSVNGVATTFGTNPDIKGINFGDWNGGRMSMVVYKSMLYPKTIPLLQINFLKNLMEKDEIIDLTNPIFIQE